MWQPPGYIEMTMVVPMMDLVSSFHTAITQVFSKAVVITVTNLYQEV